MYKISVEPFPAGKKGNRKHFVGNIKDYTVLHLKYPTGTRFCAN